MMSVIAPFIKGMGIGAGLIIAIGAQNAYVLTQGLRRNNQFVIAGICALVDAILITIGVAGMGLLVTTNPVLLQITAWAGAAFLFFYGLSSFRAALKPEVLEARQSAGPESVKKAVLTTLAVSLLNPHVYLDTVVLLGSVGVQYPEDLRIWFGVGAVVASFLWFFSLSLGAQWLAPLFRRPVAWRVLDIFVGIVMWLIAGSLVLKALS
ncbi:LysE/ArgO family amino acid transporter [Kiloniella laminariae]|uniref:LysE/ArgO family amino acid transporter n=1 Tax=Kiloniella laminariae TaxID=454162 RepID=A0ABT4LJ98_9PROT|nr:LysE/ArgO family amino acid transporter [Kiloniella laminariae]MCZ4281010.1 LysE/ArgO family amino acid transporter [Kiloniella laminariae]